MEVAEESPESNIVIVKSVYQLALIPLQQVKVLV